MSQERNLRTATLLTTALALPLLIATTVLSFEGSYRQRGRYIRYVRPKVTAFCFGYIPLLLTAAASILAIKSHKRPHIRLVSLLDLAAAICYVALLIPIFAVEVRRMNKGGLGLLIGYTTAPMIVNMLVHMYIAGRHGFTGLFSKTLSSCPNCHASLTADSSHVRETSKRADGYSGIRGEVYLDEEAPAVAPVDAATSSGQAGA